MSDKFNGMPSLKLFHETALPPSFDAVDTPEFRRDLYLLAQAFYEAGWQDCADQIAVVSGELLYIDFPEENDTEQAEQ
jgi:hypothetical protein